MPLICSICTIFVIVICNCTKAYRWNSRPLLPRDRPRALLAPAASILFPRPGTVQRAWTSGKRHAGSSIIASAPSMLPMQTCAEFPERAEPSCSSQKRRSQLAYTSFEWQGGKHLRTWHASSVTLHGKVRGCAVCWDRASVKRPLLLMPLY